MQTVMNKDTVHEALGRAVEIVCAPESRGTEDLVNLMDTIAQNADGHDEILRMVARMRGWNALRRFSKFRDDSRKRFLMDANLLSLYLDTERDEG